MSYVRCIFRICLRKFRYLSSFTILKTTVCFICIACVAYSTRSFKPISTTEPEHNSPKQWSFVEKDYFNSIQTVLIPFRFYFDVEDNQEAAQSEIPDFATTEFHYVMKPRDEFCKTGTVDDHLLLILVKSSVHHFDERRAIRETWGSTSNISNVQIKVAFLLGLSTNDSHQHNVLVEDHQHGDIVVGSYYDAYRNLTVKSLVGLQWSYQFCGNADFVLLVDDDAFLNLPIILQSYILNTKSSTKRNVLHCGNRLLKNAEVERKGKYSVPKEVYDLPIYPDYCNGICFIMSQDIARTLYLTSKRTHADIAIDDAYITGILRYKAQVSLDTMQAGSCLFFSNDLDDVETQLRDEWQRISTSITDS
ncbi:beta-1,3-galactosyltransferase 5-like [Ciona intestinalis]